MAVTSDPLPAAKTTRIRPSDRITNLDDPTPSPAATYPILTQIRYFVVTWTLKILVYLALTLFGVFYANPVHEPDFVRRYDVRPSLSVRVFLPKETEFADDKPEGVGKDLLPLYINIHGGGFVFCTASVDDAFCRAWSSRTSAIVVSLDYRKAPAHRFPAAVHGIAALVCAVIDDPLLSVDKSRVVIGGFSAGGNLALAASLLPKLRGRVHAVVAYYPIVDWSHTLTIKLQHRLYPEHEPEVIDRLVSFMDWAYVPTGQDRKDKLLSPCYARRDELPENICMIAAQYDMLCRESRDMMYSLASKTIPESGWDTGFEERGYKWVLVKGAKHGFATDSGRESAKLDERRKICDNVYTDVHRWLVEKRLI